MPEGRAEERRRNGVIGAQPLFHISLHDDYNSVVEEKQELNESYTQLQSNYTTLEQNYQSLQSDYSNLHSEKDSLQNQYNSLQNEHSTLQSQYNQMQSDYDNIQEQYEPLNNSYHSLQSNYTSLQNDYNNLQSQYQSVNTDYTSLNESYQLLQSNYNDLQTNYNSLHNDFNSIQNQYNMLKNNYSTLETSYTIESTMRSGHLLDDYYEVIREEYAPEGWWIFGPNKQDQVDFAASISGHGLGRIYWPSYEDEFYDASYNAYGSYIHSYTKAFNDLEDVTSLMDISWVTDDEATRVKKILDFIYENIHYEGDMDENFLGPMETIGLKSGDCEDYAILAGALFEGYGIESAIAFGDAGSGPHAYVLIQLDSLGSYSSYYYFDDLTGYGLSSGKWIIIEPQWRIEQQSNTVNHTLDVAAEIEN